MYVPLPGKVGSSLRWCEHACNVVGGPATILGTAVQQQGGFVAVAMLLLAALNKYNWAGGGHRHERLTRVTHTSYNDDGTAVHTFSRSMPQRSDRAFLVC